VEELIVVDRNIALHFQGAFQPLRLSAKLAVEKPHIFFNARKSERFRARTEH